ncbi:MAG: cytochrome c family protein, partial [Myxococcota bacterium]
NAKCATCHPDAMVAYEKTKHAQAWETLVSKGKQCDVGCIGCHTVGYQQPGGFCRVEDAPFHGDVGCESCHGPGAGHASAPFDKSARAASFTRARHAAVCVGCHNPQHSDLFNFDTYLPKILLPGHGQL